MSGNYQASQIPPGNQAFIRGRAKILPSIPSLVSLVGVYADLQYIMESLGRISMMES